MGWEDYKFGKVPKNYWDNISNQRKFMDDFAAQLNIENQEEWYDVTTAVLQNHGGATLLNKYNNLLLAILRTVYAEYLTDI